ncbi:MULTISPECIES: SDR family NAD(P)-dependent oxidoreductase [unclassified Aminobacter]|uniref:SDR family NAD(P)-dependent oxidoreductase n=1 Tax=unclassified Aminobacter TaxID=2644704 RepID=UPI000466A795|nr:MULTISPECIES: SDR family NAD(P)-dependent oxidoreductase [unclassified Aminobacter]TWH23963.1 short-subunit dehydrogenase [Aminobacter sp. J15]
MALYRAAPGDGVAWITGASTGIGRQLALHLADQGFVVAATARDQEGLAQLVDESKSTRGKIVEYFCDVTDEAGMESTLCRIEKELGPVVLAVFNAGIYSPTLGERLETLNFTSTFTVNVFGVLNGLVPLADRMRDRGFGQIAIIGSVTAYFGFPTAAAYGATKAALNNMAQSLRHDFDRLNIRLQIINPGFVETQLTTRYRIPMPMKMTVEDAACRIARGLQSGGFEIAFPRRLVWPMKAMRLLPVDAAHALIRRITGWDRHRLSRRKVRR